MYMKSCRYSTYSK